jgi:hypothetical protein
MIKRGDIPHQAIRDAEDRSWTGRLLDRLEHPGLAAAERSEVVLSLERLADPRAEARLGAILADAGREEAVRADAGMILRATGAVDRAAIRAMLRDGDEVLRRHAVLAMDHGEADLVLPIAADPAHALHREAIEAMEFGFEAPAHQALKIAALRHADPEVRRTAAEVLLWDQPVAAEDALHAALRDADDAVAAAAADTLRCFRSRRCLLELAAAREREGTPGDLASDSFEEVRLAYGDALQRVDGPGRAALLRWMRPVWDLLAFEDEEIAPESGERGVPASPQRDAISAEALRAALADPDGGWAEKRRLLQRADPQSIDVGARAELGRLLAAHPDPAVREEGARLLAGWGHEAAVIALIDDPRFTVMKAAVYQLGRMPPSARAARVTRAHLDDPRVRSTHAYETMEAWAAHAPRAEVQRLLVDLALHDDREALRFHAVHALGELGAVKEIGELLPLLSGPPAVTWSVHLALLEVCAGTGVAPCGHEALREVDDLDVQAALVRAS